MEPMTGTQTTNPRTETWAVLMARLMELAPTAEPDQLRQLAAAFRDLTN